MFDTNQTEDGVSDCSGVIVSGVTAAKESSCRVAVRKVAQGNNYWMEEDLNSIQVMEEVLPITVR